MDEIKTAYEILSDPVKREAWENDNKRKLLGKSIGGEEEEFVLGLEVLDLEDFIPTSSQLSPDNEDNDEREEEQIWSRPCRCGESSGFRVTERELEDAVLRGEGEVLVGCVGCSLWVRVGFGVLDCEGEGEV